MSSAVGSGSSVGAEGEVVGSIKPSALLGTLMGSELSMGVKSGGSLKYLVFPLAVRYVFGGLVECRGV